MGSNNKYLYLIIGIVLGIVIGAIAVWWLQNYDFKIWFTFSGKNENTAEYVENQINNNNEGGAESKQISGINKTERLKKDNAILNISDSNSVDYKNDFGKNDTTIEKSNDEDIVIAKDEYLTTKLIDIKGFNNQSNSKDNNLDSLLINDKTKNNLGSTVRVEFWRSPINYKGYKFINNKLILFGIYNFEGAELEYHNNKIYLIYQNNFFIIEKNNNFQPLISVKNPRK